MNEHRFSISRDGKFVFRTDWETDQALIDQTRHFLKCGFPSYQGFVIHEDNRPTHYYTKVVSATIQDINKERLERVKNLKLTEDELAVARREQQAPGGGFGKIYAIKMVRDRISRTDGYTLGLAEAKTLVERDLGEL